MSKPPNPYHKFLRWVLAGMTQREQEHAKRHPRTSDLLRSRFHNPQDHFTEIEARALIRAELALQDASFKQSPEDLKRDAITGRYVEEML